MDFLRVSLFDLNYLCGLKCSTPRAEELAG